MRVGVNLLYLKPGLVGGSEVYVAGLLRSLAVDAGDEVEATLFVNQRFEAAHAQLAAVYPVVVAPISGKHPSIRIVAESSWLAGATVTRELDVVHHVANTIPQIRTAPAAVTIHDLQPVVRPADFGSIKRRYLRGRLRRSAERSKVVMTPTEYVRRSVIDRFDVDERKVVVVPAPVVLVSPTDPGSTPESLGIGEPFYLYPAMTHPHKNHVTLIRAFARVAAEHPEPSLVLTGARGRAEATVVREIDRLDLAQRIHRLGYVDRSVLDALYARSVALTFPSRHEGYGLPVAEAMARGCPVVAANVTALPEVVAGAGLLVDPDDVEAWSAAMTRLLTDYGARAALVDAGRRRAAEMSSVETARRLLAAYRFATH
jgi:glycosyltransferase involved in cell wall biosynthesis